MAAIEAGARQVECTVNGLGERAGNVGIEEVVMSLKTRHDYFHDLQVNIDTKQFTKLSKLVSRLTGVAVPPNKAIVGSNAFAHESGIHQHGMLNNPETYEIMTPESVGAEKTNIVLGKHSGRHAFEDHLKNLGFHQTFTEEKINDLFAKFKDLADKKKHVYDDDIIALVVEHMDHKKAFELVSQQLSNWAKRAMPMLTFALIHQMVKEPMLPLVMAQLMHPLKRLNVWLVCQSV